MFFPRHTPSLSQRDTQQSRNDILKANFDPQYPIYHQLTVFFKGNYKYFLHHSVTEKYTSQYRQYPG